MKFDLLKQGRLVREPRKIKEVAKAIKFGKEYYDGNRNQGYGGYKYDGRWKPIAERIVSNYCLSPYDRILDVGCAKGFLMRDLHDLGMSVSGLDISEYAKFHSGQMHERITIGNAKNLPYKAHFFDCVVSINTIHNLDLEDCKEAIREMMRVCRHQDKIFIQVDAYNDLKKFEEWNLTARTYLRPKEWEDLFNSLGYLGDWFFTILE